MAFKQAQENINKAIWTQACQPVQYMYSTVPVTYIVDASNQWLGVKARKQSAKVRT